MLFSNYFDIMVHGFVPEETNHRAVVFSTYSDIHRHNESVYEISQPVKLLRRFSLFHYVFFLFCMMPRETNFDQSDWRESEHCSPNNTINFYLKLHAIWKSLINFSAYNWIETKKVRTLPDSEQESRFVMQSRIRAYFHAQLYKLLQF